MFINYYKFLKYYKIRILTIFTILALLTLTAGCSGGTGAKSPNNTGKPEKQGVTIVTSFYPIYLHVINITDGIPAVAVKNMTGPQTGCLHDYQLTPADMKTLEKADIFVINGAGMESFLDKAAQQLPGLKTVEASKGMELLKQSNTGEGNPHLWVSITGAIGQVRNIAQQLAAYDAENAGRYMENARKYTARLEELSARMHSELDGLRSRNIVTFHEAFPYFASEFNLKIVGVIENEAGTEPSAGELKDMVRLVREAEVRALFAEPQYSSRAADTIARETGAKVYVLDPVVTGEADGNKDAYINAMESNLKTLKEALK